MQGDGKSTIRIMRVVRVEMLNGTSLLDRESAICNCLLLDFPKSLITRYDRCQVSSYHARLSLRARVSG